MMDLQKKLKQISDSLANKVDYNKYNENLIENKTIFDNIYNELNNKYNKDDIDFLLNHKCNTNLLNSVVKEILNLIDKKLDIIEYEKYTNIQEAINNFYLSENSCGIWKCVSTKLSNNYIPFEIEYYLLNFPDELVFKDEVVLIFLIFLVSINSDIFFGLSLFIEESSQNLFG